MANSKTKAESSTATTKTTKSTNSTRKVAPANTYPLAKGYGDKKKVYNYTKLVSSEYSKLISREDYYKERIGENSFELPITLREMAKESHISKDTYDQYLYDIYQGFVKSYLAMDTHTGQTEANAFAKFIDYIHRYLDKVTDSLYDTYKVNLGQAILDYKKTHIIDLEIESAKEKKQLQKEYEEAQAAKEENQKEQESEQSGSKA